MEKEDSGGDTLRRPRKTGSNHKGREVDRPTFLARQASDVIDPSFDTIGLLSLHSAVVTYMWDGGIGVA